jgi:thymidylate kinase
MHTTGEDEPEAAEGGARRLLVCFIGVDGSGKSTMARALTDSIRERGQRCRYVYGGFTSSFTIFRSAVALARALVFRGDRHMESSPTKGRIVRNPHLSAAYQYLALSDYIFQAWFRIKLPLVLGWNVVCDRYIYDLVASVGLLLDYPLDRTLGLLRRCLAFVPAPDLVFLLDLPEALAYQRKDDIVSLDFLAARREIYLEMARHHQITLLDARSSKENLHQLAAARVLALLKGDA